MTTYICRCCKRPAEIIDQPASHVSEASQQVTCWTRGCVQYGFTTDCRDEDDMYYRFIVKDGPRVPAAIDPGREFRPRLSELDGFVPWQPGQPFPEQLRTELNVEPFLREIRRIAQQKINEQAAQRDESADPGSP
jgi:hypothetical protein